ncbi:MAG: helix-turn-helix domain-containing protein [Methylocystis sp.]
MLAARASATAPWSLPRQACSPDSPSTSPLRNQITAHTRGLRRLRRSSPTPTCRPTGIGRRADKPNDACAALGVSRSHIYNLAGEGKIRLVRIGNRTVVPESEIDRLLGEAI